MSEKAIGCSFTLPVLIVLSLVIGWSLLFSLFLSFQEVSITGGGMAFEFIGVENYSKLGSDPRLKMAFWQTIVFVIVRVSVGLTLGLILALILNQSLWGAKWLERLFLIPLALSFVVNALMWGWIYDGSFGVLNAILLKIGVLSEYQVWLANPDTALLALAFADTWKALPFIALMLLAALKTVPESLYDAAKVDGAHAIHRLIYVTLPWLRPIIAVVLVLQTMWAMKAFEIVWILTEGGPFDRTQVLNTYSYQTSFRFLDFGYGSAIVYLILGMTLIFTVLYLRLIGEEA